VIGGRHRADGALWRLVGLALLPVAAVHVISAVYGPRVASTINAAHASAVASPTRRLAPRGGGFGAFRHDTLRAVGGGLWRATGRRGEPRRLGNGGASGAVRAERL